MTAPQYPYPPPPPDARATQPGYPAPHSGYPQQAYPQQAVQSPAPHFTPQSVPPAARPSSHPAGDLYEGAEVTGSEFTSKQAVSHRTLIGLDDNLDEDPLEQIDEDDTSSRRARRAQKKTKPPKAKKPKPGKAKQALKGEAADLSPVAFSGLEDAPRSGMASGDDIRRNGKLMRFFFRSMLFLVPLCLAVATVMMVRPAPKVPEPDLSLATTSPGRAVATVEVADWLAGDPPPLPGGQIVAWTGAQSEPGPESEGKDGQPVPATFDIETNSFVLTDADGNFYTSTVQVLVSHDGGVTAHGMPSLLPLPEPPADLDLPEIWPGLLTGRAPDEVVDVIDTWAMAFVSGDATALRQVVSDPDAGHDYMPLANVKTVDVAVGQAAELAEPGDVVVRVTLSVAYKDAETIAAEKQAGKPSPPQQAAEESVDPLAPLTYDVLVIDANTGAPKVVAWGSPGSGPDLKPYENAISKVDRTALPSQDDKDAEEGTSSADPSAPTESPGG